MGAPTRNFSLAAVVCSRWRWVPMAVNRKDESHPSRRSRHLRVGGAIAVLLVINLIFSTFYVWTAPMGLVWHLLNGRFTEFEGRRVTVPWDFWASRSADGSV